jgi:hypothetical protein
VTLATPRFAHLLSGVVRATQLPTCTHTPARHLRPPPRTLHPPARAPPPTLTYAYRLSSAGMCRRPRAGGARLPMALLVFAIILSLPASAGKPNMQSPVTTTATQRNMLAHGAVAACASSIDVVTTIGQNLAGFEGDCGNCTAFYPLTLASTSLPSGEDLCDTCCGNRVYNLLVSSGCSDVPMARTYMTQALRRCSASCLIQTSCAACVQADSLCTWLVAWCCHVLRCRLKAVCLQVSCLKHMPLPGTARV